MTLMNKKELWYYIKNFYIEGLLSYLFELLGGHQGSTDAKKIYQMKLEFVAHLLAGLYLASLAWWVSIGWTLYVVYSELWIDGHWKAFIDKNHGRVDMYWDFASKLMGPTIYGGIELYRAMCC